MSCPSSRKRSRKLMSSSEGKLNKGPKLVLKPRRRRTKLFSDGSVDKGGNGVGAIVGLSGLAHSGLWLSAEYRRQLV